MAGSVSVGKSDVLIALLGLTGAGKTTFASVASGDKTLKVGHSIYPCTQDPKAIPCKMPDGRKVVLIDTPGFDDDNRSDVQILEDIAKWMAAQGYLKRHQLDGIILLHPITVHRVGGNERARTKLLQKILGENAYKRIVIATTMWEQLNSEVDMQERLDGREKDLWHELVTRGAKISKHANNRESAYNIIQEIIERSEKYGKLEPLLQVELAKNPMLVETTAGRTVKEQLLLDIKKTRELVRDHEHKKPRRATKRDQVIRPARWKEWKEWVDEKRTLEERIDMKEVQLKRLNSLSFRLKSFFVGLFGG
ncbi:GTPase IMAP family member 4 [Podospora aff. communis PSN243]|uniref:GTPase IMAP family member 4 n=1 Tax=Podospora aff. communis PSN243 TaxID=3040156 RepID=A0AAV9GPE1_9PEZI|nr:GTPase IMAP family member 4 [Podospora aff. communis PSN243]